MTRTQLHACATRYYKRGGGTTPDVALIVYGNAEAVFKDYGRAASGGFGRVIAPLLLWREATALNALDGLTGVPRVYRRVDARGLLIEHCPATVWPQARAGDAAYARLEALVQAMHDRGIAHGDLRGGGNILVDEQDQPYLVDFVSRIRRGSTWNWPWNWLFRQFVTADESALAKLRLRYARHLAEPDDERRAHPDTPLTRAARWIGLTVRRCVRCFSASD
ncbi:hypothetical protein V5738_01510 [Salinisphaera sp. SPP-AMP-43]|uniref:hypothetical protein n=1 Tax=Salinisphaera sp. SPP-AMP-43 TaxID=3121288 RepID=UPI003C6E0107